MQSNKTIADMVSISIEWPQIPSIQGFFRELLNVLMNLDGAIMER